MITNYLVKRWTTEPGKTVQQRIYSFLEGCANPGHGRDSRELIKGLDGLPFREEVTNGRDLRGINIGCFRELDLREFDFTFADLGFIYGCDFSYAKFDRATIDGSLGNFLNHASFVKASLRSCYLVESMAQSCNFESANLYHTACTGADLQGSNFRGAKCKGAGFVRANLRGCDFRKADLTDAMIGETGLDKTTDFRGACLINIQDQDRKDNAGRLLFKGSDWRQATWDATTQFGTDPALHDIDVLDELIKIFAHGASDADKKLLEATRRAREEIKRKYDKRWLDKLMAKLSASEQAMVEQALDVAYRNM